MRKSTHINCRNLAFAIAVFASAPMVFAGAFNGNTTNGNLSAWRINQTTGELSLCSFEGLKSAPTCYPTSAKGPDGTYDVLDGDDLMSRWRINRATGAMSLCEYKDTAKAPDCTPWSQ
jgi:hypothetical protein